MIHKQNITPGLYFGRAKKHTEVPFFYVHVFGEVPFLKAIVSLELPDTFDVDDMEFICRIPSPDEDHVIDENGYIRKP